MPKNKSSDYLDSLKSLFAIVTRLRDPAYGCPWDLNQTNKSLIPFLIEEAYEVANAIRNKDDKNLKEELGDLLFQILMHAEIAKEEKRFYFNEIIESLSNKLIRRHPHVFGKLKASNIDEVTLLWEKIKLSEEVNPKSNTPLTDRLKRKIYSQPSLKAAIKISNKSGSIGFEWKEITEIFNKLDEEIQELKDALKKQSRINIEEEIGDILFTVVNLARWCKLDPEECLSRTNRKFINRFTYIEKSLGGELSNISRDELKKQWHIAKKQLKIKEIYKKEINEDD